MELVFTILTWLVPGFFGLIGALVLLALLFGKRVESRFDLEAEFRDESDRKVAEFDIKSWRNQKDGNDYQFDATFQWRDPGLTLGDTLEIFLDDVLILKGPVEHAGKVALYEPHVQNVPESADVGQLCRVMLNSVLVMQEPVIHD